MTILPSSKEGKWSLVLFASFLVLGLLGNLVSSWTNNQLEYPNPVSSPILGSVIYLGFAAAIAASVMGCLAIFKRKDLSVLVFLCIPIGALLFLGVVMLLVGLVTGI